VERIRTIFQRHVVGYYNLFDIIAGRSDLPALVEGDPTPLALFASTKYSDKYGWISNEMNNSTQLNM